MKNTIIAAAILLLIPAVALGAKAHREAKKELTPKIQAAATAIKEACGASPKLDVDWATFGKTKSDQIKDYKSNIGREFDNIANMSKKFCSDAESKALFKKNAKKIIVSTIEGGSAETTYSKGTFTIKTSNQSNSGGYKFQEIMDEW